MTDVEQIARLPIESWSEFRDRTPELVSYLVSGLVPEGSLTFLAAPPKGGKTWIGLALALSVSTGRPFLGRFTIPEAAPVLYLALEGQASAIRARVGSMARGLGVDPDQGGDLARLTIAYRPGGLDLMDITWADELVRTVEQIGARMVVVDVLRAAAPKLRESYEGAGDFARIVVLLAPLLKAGVSIVLLHHFTKSGDSSRGRSIGERMTGSGALFGAADLVLGITGSDPRDMRLEAIGRDAATPEPFGVLLEGHGTAEHGGFGYRDTLRVVAHDEAPPAAMERSGRTLKGDPLEIAAYVRSQPNGQASPGAICQRFSITDMTLKARRDALEELGIEYQAAGKLSVYYASGEPSQSVSPKSQLWGEFGNPDLPHTQTSPVGGLGFGVGGADSGGGTNGGATHATPTPSLNGRLDLDGAER